MLETAKMMFQINQNGNQFAFENAFIKTKNMDSYNTRQSSSEGFSLPTISTNLKRNFSHSIALNCGTRYLLKLLPAELKEIHIKIIL